MKILTPPDMALLYRSLRLARVDSLAIGVMACFRFGKTGADALIPEHEMWPLVMQALGKDAILDEGYPKPAGEFKVYGAACAPEGTQIAEQRVRMKIGALSKALVVTGDRQFDALGRICAPKPYARMPIEPATAFGGAQCADNPRGKGFAEVAKDVFPLPNVESETSRIVRRGDRAAPAGFWGFDSAAPLRQQHLGTCDDRWLKSGWPHLPDDTRPEWFMTAAQDQRLPGYFAGDERFEIDNMHPRQRTQQGALPGLRARCFVNVRTPEGDTLREVDTRAETVWLFPELECGIVLYRALARSTDSDASDMLHVKAVWEPMSAAALSFEHYRDVFRAEIATAVKAKSMAAAPVAPAPAQAAAVPAVVDASAVAAAEQSAQIDAHLAQVNSLAGDLDVETRALMQKYRLSDADIAPYMKAADLPAEPAPKISDLGKMVEELNAQTHALMAQHKLSDADVARYMSTPAEAPAPTFAQVGAMIDDLNAQTRALVQQHGLTQADLLQYMQPGVEVAAPVAGESAALALLPLDALVIPAAPKLEAPSLAKPKIEAAAPAHMPLTRDDVIARHAARESLANCDLSSVDLSKLDLSGADFSGAILDKTSFAGSRLADANFSKALLPAADFSDADLQRAQFTKSSAAASTFAKADLRGAQLVEGDFTGADFSASKLSNADLRGAIFDQAKLASMDASSCRATRASFTDADLTGAKFNGAELVAASFSGSVLAGSDFTASACAQAEFYGAQAQQTNFTDADLSHARADAKTSFDDARFTRARLNRAAWDGVQIRRANFERAVLDHADFSHAQAQAARFGASSAKGARFDKADLAGADLDAVNLFTGSLRQANLKGTRLRHANLYGVDFDGTQPTIASLEGSNIDRTILQFRPPVL
ncbi:pentapeptide repeat-containing protein [Caballeronia arvi]|uniref:Pentapeptide repeat-containing protein n=1 Tax=Caballeronia arvi TaxID=1777135 RepID=A0A158IVB8_9BURK|nr:pentapeptide repeat-containing protein [Caballeronia arvi]SAL60518.1 pentapeptide repeat-containing protein [Caballeronia arvi]